MNRHVAGAARHDPLRQVAGLTPPPLPPILDHFPRALDPRARSVQVRAVFTYGGRRGVYNIDGVDMQRAVMYVAQCHRLARKHGFEVRVSMRAKGMKGVHAWT